MPGIFVLFLSQNGDMMKSALAIEVIPEKSDENLFFLENKSFGKEDFGVFKILDVILNVAPFWSKKELIDGCIVPWPRNWAIRINFQTGIVQTPPPKEQGSVLLVIASNIFNNLDEARKDQFNNFLSVLRTFVTICQQDLSQNQKESIFFLLKRFRTMVTRQRGKFFFVLLFL